MPIFPWTRRRVLLRTLHLGVMGLLPAALTGEALAQQNGGGIALRGRPAASKSRPGTSLVLLGTHGGPGIDLTRAQTSSALVVDGMPYLIDCGYGAVRQLVASHVGYLGVNCVFFTHLHDDHTADLAALLSFQWTNGKTTPTDAYGPFGTTRMVEAALEFFGANVAIRTVDEGRKVDPAKQFRGHDVQATKEPLRIFADDRVVVSAVENTHYPPRSTARMPYRSIALRFDSRQRSIVFSGDTAYSANLVKLARGADVFVCEIIDPSVLEQMRTRARESAAAGNPNNIYRHVAETHSSPADVARMATEARVKTVVLNHLVFGPAASDGLPYATTTLINDVRAGFRGEVIVGQDLMVL